MTRSRACWRAPIPTRSRLTSGGIARTAPASNVPAQGRQPVPGRDQHGKQKSKTYKLGPVSATVRAGHGLTLTINLPAAVTALGNGANESAMFTVTATNANGAGRATTKIATLKGT